MAEETTNEAAAKSTEQSVRTVIVGACIILWLTAIYMINLMNGISQKLEKIDMDLQSSNLSTLNHRPLENYQVVDKDGNVVYSFQIDPKLFETGESEMMEGASCPAAAPQK